MRSALLPLLALAAFGLACMSGEPEPRDDRPGAEQPRERPDRERNGQGRRRGGRGGGGSGGGGGDETPAEQPAPAPAPSPAPGGGSNEAPSTIRYLGNDTWEVERRQVDRWEDNPSSLCAASQKGNGWELKRVNKGDCAHLGMQNGDVVKSANGYTLGSNTELAMAYAALKDAKRLTVKFKRDGSNKTHTYKITD